MGPSGMAPGTQTEWPAPGQETRALKSSRTWKPPWRRTLSGSGCEAKPAARQRHVSQQLAEFEALVTKTNTETQRSQRRTEGRSSVSRRRASRGGRWREPGETSPFKRSVGLVSPGSRHLQLPAEGRHRET